MLVEQLLNQIFIPLVISIAIGTLGLVVIGLIVHVVMSKIFHKNP